VITRRLGTLMTVIVLAASGGYLLVYLYRWEWNRALVAGIIFVAAEIAIVATALLRKLRALEQRLDEVHRATPSQLERIQEAAPGPPKFDWLGDPTQLHVFVPVLLGAGVILSLVAHGVERLASATTTPVHERDLAARLGAIALPAGGMRPATTIGLGALDVPDVDAGRWRTMVRRVFGLVVAAFLLVVGIQVIADETQDRDDPPMTTGTAAIQMAVHNRFTTRSQLHTAEALYIACRHTIGGSNYRATSFRDMGDGMISFQISPDFGQHAERRFEGCVEDALFDRISASVVRLDHKP
jgi:hypothetical protein